MKREGYIAKDSSDRALQAFTLTEMVTALVLMLSIALLLFWFISQKSATNQCRANLQRVYMALEMFEIDRGMLPEIAFFPQHPITDEFSLRKVLTSYEVTKDSFICPKTHRQHQDLGLTYVWNTRLNNRELYGPEAREWMMVEINALSDRVPAPHIGHYNILYTDGHVQASTVPPDSLRER